VTSLGSRKSFAFSWFVLAAVWRVCTFVELWLGYCWILPSVQDSDLL